jgi:hypothetical protein
METKRKRPPSASGTDAMAAETPVPAEAPAEIAPGAPAPETEPMPAQHTAAGPAPDEIARFGRDALTALAESQAATARCLVAMSDAVAGLTRSGIDIAARTATEMLGVKTLSDAYAVSALFAGKSFDSLLGGSAQLSGLGVKLAAEASRPILTQLGQSWIKAAGFAR